MIAYLIESSTLLLFFGLVYLLFLRTNTRYNFLRGYIFSTILISALLPFAPSFFTNAAFNFGIVLPELTVLAHGNAISDDAGMLQEGTQTSWIFICFVLISFVITIRLIVAIYKIAVIISQSDKKTFTDIIVRISGKVTNAFSFFHYVVLPSKFLNKENDLGPIIKHEKLHIAFDHSIEKVCIELIKCVLWWHPVIWLYRRELDLIHEYQVDQAMGNNMDTKEYKTLLLQLALQPSELQIVNPISSNIIKRIKKMNQEKKKSTPLHFAPLLTLLLIGSLFIHSCQKDEITSNLEPLTSIDSGEKVKYSDGDKISFEIDRVDTITTFDYDTYEETVEIVAYKEKIYRTPSQMPVFPGCDNSLSGDALTECSNQNLLKYIYTNIKYPSEARLAGIEGTVLVTFIILPNGTMGNLEYVRTLEGGIKEEVQRLIKQMQKEITWKPGMQDGKEVSVQYTLPIKFKLEE